MQRNAIRALATTAAALSVGTGMLSILFGCGSLVVDPMPDIPENVQYDTVRIEYGTDDALEETPEQGLVTVQQELVGEPSQLAAFTTQAVGDTNEVVFHVFEQVDEITSSPATSYDEDLDRWTWEAQKPLRGIYMRFELDREPVSERLRAQDVRSAISFRFFYGRDASDHTLVYSGYYNGFDERTPAGARQRGFGVVRLFLGALSQYDDEVPSGTIRVAFRSSGRNRQVLTSMFGVEDRAGEKLNALYTYVQRADDQGRFVYFGRQDFDADGAREFFSVRSAWTATKEGRVAARITGGSLELDSIHIQQCWDADQVAVWERSRAEFSNAMREVVEQEQGERDACAEPLRPLELTAPAYVPVDDEDPSVPAPLEEEGF
ncbi:MAG: hypothetical protein AAGI01_13045 [Myxococcota bacterium]